MANETQQNQQPPTLEDRLSEKVMKTVEKKYAERAEKLVEANKSPQEIMAALMSTLVVGKQQQQKQQQAQQAQQQQVTGQDVLQQIIELSQNKHQLVGKWGYYRRCLGVMD